LAAYPIEFYVQNHRVEEWMITASWPVFLLGSFALMLLLATRLTNQMAFLGSRRAEAESFWSSLCSGILRRGALVAALVVSLVGAATFLLWPGNGPSWS
jgi:hypothetical protein